MKQEKGVIIAAFDGNGRVAVLKRKEDWEGWELPIGHLENDDYQETVRIELEEEAGIEPEQITGIEPLEDSVSWTYEEDGETFRKEYRMFMVETDAETVSTANNPHQEHEHGFFLRPRDVREMLEFKNNVKVLEKALQARTG